MKKFVLVILCMLLSTSAIYADTGDYHEVFDESKLEPKSIYVTNKRVLLDISGSKAQYSGSVIIANYEVISKCVLTIKLVNKNGMTLKTNSSTVYISTSECKISDSCNLNAKGEYKAEFTAKLYRGSKPVETIRGSSSVQEYK